jgi:hypothetical protein
MCFLLGIRISLPPPPPPPRTLSFHKPSDAELTYFLGAEIQRDERRFTSHFFCRNFGILPTNPYFLSSIWSSLSTLLALSFYSSLTPFVTPFLSFLFFSSHGYFYPPPGSFFLFSSSFHIGSFVDFYLSFWNVSVFLFILGKFFVWTFKSTFSNSYFVLISLTNDMV